MLIPNRPLNARGLDMIFNSNLNLNEDITENITTNDDHIYRRRAEIGRFTVAGRTFHHEPFRHRYNFAVAAKLRTLIFLFSIPQAIEFTGNNLINNWILIPYFLKPVLISIGIVYFQY